MSPTVRRLNQGLIPLVAAVATSAGVLEAQVRVPDRGRGRDDLTTIRQRTERLASALEHLQEDIRIELEGRQARELFRQADQALEEALHFQRSLRPGIDRRHIVQDFQALDRQVHELLRNLERVPRRGALARGAARVRFADEQLHFAVFRGDRTDGRIREVIARQAHVLENQSHNLLQAARFVVGPGRRGRELMSALQQFVEEAEHFHESVEKGADRKHAARDFAELDRSWHELVRRLNASAYGAYLRRRAEQVNAVHNQLHELLQIDSDRPRVRYRFETGSPVSTP